MNCIAIFGIGFCLIASTSSLECYVGRGDHFTSLNCLDSVCEGIDCMCVKIPDFMGEQVRACWANPHQAQSPGCSTTFYRGVEVTACKCETDLCNSSPSYIKSEPLTVLPASLILFFLANIL